MLCICGLLHIVRLSRWTGYRTFADRLVLILHVAYLFVPVGFVLTGLSDLGLVPPGAGIHAWTGGAVGAMTLAVMTRATLGHTGRQLYASAATQAVYLGVVIAAITRICAALEPDHAVALLAIAGTSWAFAFFGFAIAYASPLWSRKTAENRSST